MKCSHAKRGSTALLALLSFLFRCARVCKGWSTFLVLKSLDSVLKNIGEARTRLTTPGGFVAEPAQAVAILVIYVFDVFIADAVCSSAYRQQHVAPEHSFSRAQSGCAGANNPNEATGFI